MILARGRKGGGHFRGRPDQRDDNETDKGRSHSERDGGFLHRTDEHFAYQGDKDRHARQRPNREADGPCGFLFLCDTSEQFAVGLERKEQAECIGSEKQDRQRHTQLAIELRALRRQTRSDGGRNEERDGREKEKPGLHSALRCG